MIPSFASFTTACIGVIIALFLFSRTPVSLSQAYCVPLDSPYTITTLNDSIPWAKCFRVHDGLFTDVSTEQYESSEGITYLDGWVLPGLIDAHGHPLQYGEMLASVSLYGAESTQDVKSRIKEYLRNHEGEGYGTQGMWLKGWGGIRPTLGV